LFQFVRESVVQMPEEDFSEWFQERVDPSVHSPPPLNPAATWDDFPATTSSRKLLPVEICLKDD